MFLKPGKKTLQRMQDKEVAWVRFSDDTEEVVAIVDLSQSRAEAEAMSVKATRSGTYGGFQFTPEKWRWLRASKTVDLESQKAMIAFLTNVVLREKSTLASVRSYLATPTITR